MTVTLLEAPGGDRRNWQGATKRSPARPSAQLAAYLATLAERACLATVGESQRRRPVLEVEPGAVFDAHGISLPSGTDLGAVLRLALAPNRRDVRAELAVPSDLSYLPTGKAGRAAVVMPKTTLLRAGALARLTPDRSRPDYRVGGLPGIEQATTSPLSRELMVRPHPKTALVTRIGARVDIVADGEGVLAGSLVQPRAPTPRWWLTRWGQRAADRGGLGPVSFADARAWNGLRSRASGRRSLTRTPSPGTGSRGNVAAAPGADIPQ